MRRQCVPGSFSAHTQIKRAWFETRSTGNGRPVDGVLHVQNGEIDAYSKCGDAHVIIYTLQVTRMTENV